METQKLITIMNFAALIANAGLFIFGAFVLYEARKLNKEFREYINNLKK